MKSSQFDECAEQFFLSKNNFLEVERSLVTYSDQFLGTCYSLGSIDYRWPAMASGFSTSLMKVQTFIKKKTCCAVGCSYLASSISLRDGQVDKYQFCWSLVTL